MDFAHAAGVDADELGNHVDTAESKRSFTFWTEAGASDATPGQTPRMHRHHLDTAETRRLLKRVLEPEHKETCSQWAIPESSKFREIWNLVMFPVLVYVGTLLPYKLCFMEFHVIREVEVGTVWQVMEFIMEVVFVFDLFLPFFFTYRDILNNEVASLPHIASHYLRTSFFINLIACFPPALIEAIVESFTGTNKDNGDSNLHKGVRFFKIQRTARILRLVRILRIFKILEESSRWRWFKHLRPVRIVSFVLKLFWVVHLAACGWYLVAALHEPVEASWPFRVFDPVTLRTADAGPGRSWMVSYYFSLTVFTTVGFGDISPETSGEIVYVCGIMCAGSVVNGMVMSEIISILTKSGRLKTHVEEQEKLVKEFARQTQLKSEAENWLKQWISTRRAVHNSHDKDKMIKLLMGSSFPRAILGKIPSELFQGRLIKNRFITLIKHTCQKDWPIQLPLFVGITGNLRKYDMGEVVYYASDHPWNVFLILRGIFSHVASVNQRSNSVRSLSFERSSPSGNFEQDKACFYPCCIFGFGNYFGDEEIILRRRHRRSTVRCESPTGGELVVLQKNDFLRLTREFPDMAHMWLQNAFRRERKREMCVKRLTSGELEYADYTELAALQLQASIREFLHRRRRERLTSKKFARRNSATDGMGGLADDVSMMLSSKQKDSPRSQEVTADKFALLSEEVADLKSSMMILLDGQRKLQATVQALSGGRAPRRTQAPAKMEELDHEPTSIYAI